MLQRACWRAAVALGVLAGTSLALLGCGDDADEELPPVDLTQAYVTSTVVLSNEGESSYILALPTLDPQSVSIKRRGREVAGWAGAFVLDGKVFVSDGESPKMNRLAIDATGRYTAEGTLDFMSYGAEFAGGGVVNSGKAYLFTTPQTIVWSPGEMTVKGTFPLPTVADREGGHEYSGLSSDRQWVTRGKRAYVATNWANWDTYTVAEDSQIVVIDTETDTVLKSISVPCPYIDVASIDDEGYVYFSNWVYSIDQTLKQGKKKACAVRLPPDKDELDPDWSLTFADVTGGREGGVLRYVGNGKALFVAYHHERVPDINAMVAPGALAGLDNWQFWLLDLKTRQASQLSGIDFNSGGFNAVRVDGRAFVMVPKGDYSKTSVYELLPTGVVEPRWTIDGWSTVLAKLR